MMEHRSEATGSDIARKLVGATDLSAHRPEALRSLDVKRDLEPDWFMREDMARYVYIGRFSDDLKGVFAKAAYLEELGVKYVHITPRRSPPESGLRHAGMRDGFDRLGNTAVQPRDGALPFAPQGCI